MIYNNGLIEKLILVNKQKINSIKDNHYYLRNLKK